jgi:hypothetical protein
MKVKTDNYIKCHKRLARNHKNLILTKLIIKGLIYQISRYDAMYFWHWQWALLWSHIKFVGYLIKQVIF